MNAIPIAINRMMTDTLVITITLLKLADSRIPIINSKERTTTINIAGIFRIAVT